MDQQNRFRSAPRSSLLLGCKEAVFGLPHRLGAMFKRGGISSPENSSLQYLPVVYPAAAARPESGLREVELSDLVLLKAVHGHFEVIVIAVGSHKRVDQFLDLFHGRAFPDTAFPANDR